MLLDFDEISNEENLSLFKIGHDVWIGEADGQKIADHANRLVGLSASLEEWKNSQYSHIITFADAATLSAIRSCWKTYAAGISESRNKAWKRDVKKLGEKYSYRDLQLEDAVADLSRSTGAWVPEEDDEINTLRMIHWGKTVKGPRTDPSQPLINPLIAHSTGAGGHFSMSRNTSIFHGYHLAYGFITRSAYFEPEVHYSRVIHDEVQSYQRMLNLSLQQWHIWSSDFLKDSKLSPPKLRLRFFAGDPCAFMLASSTTKLASNLTALYSKPWTGEKLKLDSDNLGPAKFNVVEASDMIDSIGIYNLLICVIPLLSKSAASTLYTDTLFLRKPGESPKALLSRMLGSDIPVICSLLGIAPLSYLTGVDPRGSGGFPTDGPGLRATFNRIVWKIPHLGDQTTDLNNCPNNFACGIDEMVNLLFRLYQTMLAHYRQEFFDDVFERALKQGALHLFPLLYTQRGYAALVGYLKSRVNVEWDVVIRRLIPRLDSQVTKAGDEEASLGELLLEFHLLGVFTHDDLSIPNNTHWRRDNPFLPPAVAPPIQAVILTIPRSKLLPLQKDFIALQDHLKLYFDSHFHRHDDRCCAISSCTPVFGKLSSGDAGYTIKADPAGWYGKSDLHLSLYVPTHVVKSCPCCIRDDATIGITPMRDPTLAALSNRKVHFMSAYLEESTFVKIMDTFPGIEAPSPKVTESSTNVVRYTDVKIKINYPVLNIEQQTMTVKVTLRDQDFKRQLSDGLIVKLDATPCTATVTCGTFRQKVQFPFPIANPVARISRQAGWIEIVAKLSSPSTLGGYYSNPFPIVKSGNVSHSWNFPAVDYTFDVDRVDLSSRSNDWLIRHMLPMLSPSESVIVDNWLNTDEEIWDPMSGFKASVSWMFNELLQSNFRVFEIKATPTSIPFLVFYVHEVYLDDASNNIVAAAYVIEIDRSKATLPNWEKTCLFPFIMGQSTPMIIGEAGVEGWKLVLPALAARTQNVSHSRNCGLSKDPSAMCDCATSILEADSIASKSFWTKENPSVYRIGISPVFPPSFCDPVVKSKSAKKVSETPVKTDAKDDKEKREAKEKEEKEKEKIGGKENGVKPEEDHAFRKCAADDCKNRAGKICAKCRVVAYCSRDCQSKDWARHRPECGRQMESKV